MRAEAELAIRPVEYPVLHTGPRAAPFPAPAPAPKTQEPAPEEVLARQLEAARREGVEKGKQLAAAESAAWRQQRAADLASAVEAFRAGRDAYLAQVEKEVVRLALAIAERILHRESQLDPLLLSGAVRAALAQLAETTEVRLRVPADQRELWTDVVRLMPGLRLRPQVLADADLPGGAVRIESILGTVDLSVQAQLEEIERGFFDRVEARRERPAAPGAIPAKAGA